MGSKKKLKVVLLISLPLLILIGLLLVYKFYFSNRIYINPTAPRGFFSDSFPAGPCTNFKQYTDAIKVIEDPVKGELYIDDNAVERKSGPYLSSSKNLIVPLAGGQWGDLPDGGRVRVSYLAGGRGVLDRDDPAEYQVAFSDQSPSNKKIFPTDRPVIDSPDNGVRMILEFEGTYAGIIKGVNIKDAQTGNPVGGAYTNYYDHHLKALNRIGFEADTCMYHQNPVECTISLDYGKEMIYTAPLNEKTMIHLSKYDLSLIKVYPVKKDASEDCFDWFDPSPPLTPSPPGLGMGPFGMETTSASNTLIKLNDYDPNGEWTRLAMAGSADRGGRYDVYLQTKDGHVSPCMKPRYSWIGYYTFSIPMEEVVALQIRERPYIAVIKYQLEELPGLLPENRGVKNLMDVEIEAIRIHSQREFENVLQWGMQLVDLDTNGASPTFPTGYFSKDFHDVTFKDLLDEYTNHLPADEMFRKMPNHVGLTTETDEDGWFEPFLKGLF